MTFAPPAIFCEDCHHLKPADDVERRPHATVVIAECRCGHFVSRVFPTLLSPRKLPSSRLEASIKLPPLSRACRAALAKSLPDGKRVGVGTAMRMLEWGGG